MAGLALQSANTRPDAMHDLITSMAQGEPRWLATTQDHAASLLAGKGLATAVVLAAVMVAIAAAPYLRSSPATQSLLVLAIAGAALIWVIGEAMGGLTEGTGTDLNSGPLLVLLALAYLPQRAETHARQPQPSVIAVAGEGISPLLPRQTVDTGSLGGAV